MLYPLLNDMIMMKTLHLKHLVMIVLAINAILERYPSLSQNAYIMLQKDLSYIFVSLPFVYALNIAAAYCLVFLQYI